MRNFFPTELKASRDEARRRGVRGPGDLPTGLLDVEGAMHDTFVFEDLSISESLNMKKKMMPQLSLLLKKANPSVQSDILRQRVGHRGYFEGWMRRNSEYIKEMKASYPDAGFKTVDEIEKEIANEARALREKFESASSRATGFDRVAGSLLGAMRGSFRDPLVLATIWMGAARSASILRTAVTEFAIGAGTELAIQPIVYGYKKKIDSPYSVRQAFTNVLAVGTGAAIFGGTVKAAIKGFDALVAKGKIQPNLDAKAARDVLNEMDEVMDGSPFDNSKPENRDAHVKAFDKAVQDVGEGRVADVAEIVGPIERNQPETVPAGKKTAKEPWEMTSEEFRQSSIQPEAIEKTYKENFEAKGIVHKGDAQKYLNEIASYYAKKHNTSKPVTVELSETGSTAGLALVKDGYPIDIPARDKTPISTLMHELEHVADYERGYEPHPNWWMAKEKGHHFKEYTREFFDKERLHRQIVKRAISEGKPVPPEVLKDYPDLVSKSYRPEEGGGYRIKDLDYIESRIKEGAPGKRLFIDDDTPGQGTNIRVIAEPSSYPDWFQNKGYTRKESLNIIKKARAGKKLTAKQAGILDDLVEGSRREISDEIFRAKAERDRPQSVNEADLEVGDKFKIHGEKYEKTGDTPEGGSILKDGETIVTDPFEEIPIDRGESGIKKTDYKNVKATEEIGRFFDEAFAGDKNKRKTLSLGKVDAVTAEKIKEASKGKIDVAGYEHVLSDDALRHVLNKHGEKATGLYEGELPITKEDLSLIPEIVTEPDNISVSKTEQGLDAIKYEKRFNGEIIYVEEIRTGKKKLALKTMWKRGAAADVPSKRPSRPTSETLRTPDSTIGQKTGEVKAFTEADEAAHMAATIREAEEMAAADPEFTVGFKEDDRSFTMNAREALEETDKEIDLFKKIGDCLQ